MPIEFLCEHCGTKLRTPDGTSGKKTKCPKCEALLVIPESSVASPPVVLPPDPSAPVAAQPFNTGNSREWQGFENTGSAGSDDFNFAGFTESGNPWQAPADDGPELSVRRTTSVYGDQLGFSQAFGMTYQTMKSNFLPFFVLGIIFIGFGAVAYVITFALAFLMDQNPNVGFIFVPFGIICFYIILPLMMMGLYLCALELIRTGRTSLATGFSDLKSVLSLICFGLLLGLVSLAVIGVPAMGIVMVGLAVDFIGGGGGGPGVGTVISVILGYIWYFIALIFLTFRLGMFGPLLIVDQKVSAFQAFPWSWEITKRNTLVLFCIYLVFGIGAIIGTFCTLGLGYFVVLPFMICLTSMCYHIMWEQHSARTDQQQVNEW